MRSLRRLGTWLATLLMIIGTVVIGQYIIDTTPIGSDHRRPFLRTAPMGEPVDAGPFEVTVLSTRGGRVIADLLDQTVTDGVYIAVRLRLMADDARAALKYAAIRDARDNWYEAISGNELISWPLQPRVPIEGEVFFELPVTAAQGPLTLRLSSYGGYTHHYQVSAEIPLDVDASDVDGWYHSDEPLTLTRPEAVAP